MDMQQQGMQQCGCPHHKTVPILVVVFGLLFLLHAFNAVSDEVVTIGWPVIVIAAGLTKMLKGMCGCCKSCG